MSVLSWHKDMSLKTLLDTTCTYVHIVNVCSLQCTCSSVNPTVGIFLDSNATTTSKPNNIYVLLPSEDIRTYSEHVLRICHLALVLVSNMWYCDCINIP